MRVKPNLNFVKHSHWVASLALHAVAVASLSWGGFGEHPEDLVSFGDISIEILGVEDGQDGDGLQRAFNDPPFVQADQLQENRSQEDPLEEVRSQENQSQADQLEEEQPIQKIDQNLQAMKRVSPQEDQASDSSSVEEVEMTESTFDLAVQEQQMVTDRGRNHQGLASSDSTKLEGLSGTQGGGALHRSYQEMLYSYLERNKHYPMMARRMRIEGVVGVQFRVLRDGSIVDIQVSQPSQAEVLNQAAIISVERAHQKMPLPESFEVDELPVKISFNYQMR